MRQGADRLWVDPWGQYYSLVDVWVRSRGLDADENLLERLDRAAGWSAWLASAPGTFIYGDGMIVRPVDEAMTIREGIDCTADSAVATLTGEGLRVRKVQKDYGCDLVVIDIA
ncbi:MAG: hypothetical protein JKP92_05215 [Alphaproteobacteria bacterium]|jgi:hypothetical protein|nr:hypothetical protein [Alphaproteobacteria bacterium]